MKYNPIESIFKLNINYDDELIDLLLSIPKNFSLLFLNLLQSGKVNVHDLKVIINNIRNIVYDDSHSKVDLREIIVKKLKGDPITETFYQEGFKNEQTLIHSILTDLGIRLDSSFVQDIFVDEKNIKKITVNFFDVSINFDEAQISKDVQLKDSELKKHKQLEAFVKLKLADTSSLK